MKDYEKTYKKKDGDYFDKIAKIKIYTDDDNNIVCGIVQENHFSRKRVYLYKYLSDYNDWLSVHNVKIKNYKRLIENGIIKWF